MPKKRTFEDGRLTSSEKSRIRSDRFACIDNQLNDALADINWTRRNEAEKDIAVWVNTYGVGLLLEDAPPEKGNEVLRSMVKALTSHNNYLITMSRGQGKSCYVLLSTIFAIVTGILKFILIVSNNARASVNLLNDIWRIIAEPGTPFAQDYPEACLPFLLCQGSFRRRQMYRDKATDIVRNAGNLKFARLEDENGIPYKCSEAIIATRGYTSGLRGLRSGKQRVTSVILDDILDSQTACNPEQVEKILDIINKDITPMGGKERLSILLSATPICVDDLVDKLKSNSNWITQTYPAIIHYPYDILLNPEKGLWHLYFTMFDSENINGEGHQKSLEFYKSNKDKMDEGSEVFNPTRFSLKDGHISAILKLLEIKHSIGESAFASEYQMSPIKYHFLIDISPKDVVSKQLDVEEGILPDGYLFAVASSDLNLSFCVSTTVVGFKVDGTAHVLKHIFRKCRIGGTVADAQYNKSVYDLLVQHGNEIRDLGIPLKGWAIDCNGLPFNAVTQFCNNSMQICGLQACGFIGKASHLFNGNVRSRLRAQIGRTVLCGDALELIKAGSGKKWVAWDSDYYREMVLSAFLANVGSNGCLTLYKGDTEEHRDYAMQVCAEKLKFKRHRQDGRDEYTWKSSNDHDMLDSTAQAFACATQFGISPENFSTMCKTKIVKKVKKLKFV